MKLNSKSPISLGVPADMVESETARQYARSVINQYDEEVGDIDFGNDTTFGLFVKYLARVASGNDTMRGYWAAFNRKPLLNQ